MKNFFNTCKTLDEAKQLFKKLALENHPDRGGDTATMQEINKQYKFICAKLAKANGATEKEATEAFELSEKYQNAINKIAGLENITIELVGSWVWVTGDTYSAKETLKNAGFMFAPKKNGVVF